MRVFEKVGILARWSSAWSKLGALLLMLTIGAYCLSSAADRSALPAPTEADLPRTAASVAPRNETERLIAAVWQEVGNFR